MDESLDVSVSGRFHLEKPCLSATRPQRENLLFHEAVKSCCLGPMVGKSKSLQKVFRLIIRFANDTANVIIEGESGTGKELVARTIHDLGPRSNKCFVPVNCGAIPFDLLESEFFGHKKGAFTGAVVDKHGYLGLADQGTLFLDEVGELAPSLQVKLLRVIDGCGYTPVGGTEVIKPDVRIIAATNQDLRDYVRKKMIREDFYYRIHVLPIQLPPLRERKEDIPLLINYFLLRYGRSGFAMDMPAEYLERMQRHNWPGNIRELRNTILRYLTLNEIQFINPVSNNSAPLAADNPDTFSDCRDLKSALDEFEGKYILKCLEMNDWHQSRTATFLKINRKTLYQKIQQHGIQRTYR